MKRKFAQYDTGELTRRPVKRSAFDADEKSAYKELTILPLKNNVLFPGMSLPITVVRASSIKLVKEAYKKGTPLGVIAQKDESIQKPEADDLYSYGTTAQIVQLSNGPDGKVAIVVHAGDRFSVKRFRITPYYLTAEITLRPDAKEQSKEKPLEEMRQSLHDAALNIFRLNSHLPQAAAIHLSGISDVGAMIHFLCTHMELKLPDKQKLLEAGGMFMRGKLLSKFMEKELQRLEIKNRIQDKVNTDMDKQQRDYILRQQIKALQDELGDHDENSGRELEHLRMQGKKKKWPDTVAERFEKELDKLRRMGTQTAEYPMTMNYVEFMLDLPWQKYTTDSFDLDRAAHILDTDHFGLEKVKTRILEYLAVLKLKRDMKGPILCLLGPPGVGKTSLGRSIAQSLKRRYIRMSLGGVHDEAEIRGHRRTYVGAMPGKILQYVKKAKSSNPVFILDEIDKVRASYGGDPSSALLEVLDPEQNDTFVDNYLEVEYDLSKALFVATANSMDSIQEALRDRMEIIEISGYTIEEKTQIALRHLVPKQLAEHGLKGRHIEFDPKAIVKIIENYTSESGVRELERKIGAVLRRIAKRIVMGEKISRRITEKYVAEALGTEIFQGESYQEHEMAGIVTGLAWTRVGGDILFVESSVSKGRGKLTLSGQLGEVMRESATTALSYLRYKADALDIDHRLFQQYDLHIHVPSGAIPKDGPSAGITIFTALASVFTQRRIKPKVAMTGEITLRGKVLPVGGIKEKILAAKRHGVKEIVLSDRNKREINDIEVVYRKGLKFHFVDTVDEVLEVALLKEKVKKPLVFDTQPLYASNK